VGLAAAVFFVAGVVACGFGYVADGVPGLLAGALLIFFSLVLVHQAVSLSGRRRELVTRSVRATEESVHKG
jgi:hypothetical protein